MNGHAIIVGRQIATHLIFKSLVVERLGLYLDLARSSACLNAPFMVQSHCYKARSDRYGEFAPCTHMIGRHFGEQLLCGGPGKSLKRYGTVLCVVQTDLTVATTV